MESLSYGRRWKFAAAVFAVGLGSFWVVYVSPRRQLLSALSEFEQAGGKVAYFRSEGVFGSDLIAIYKSVIDDVARLLKVRSFNELTIRGDGTILAEDALAPLSRLKNLKRLRIHSARIGDAELRHISRSVMLEELEIVGNPDVTDAGLQHLATLRNLRQLSLMYASITDTGVQHFRGLIMLQQLDLDQTAIGDEGLRHLTALQHLQLLSVRGTRVTEAGREELMRAVPNLKIVYR
jgi:hypothetical protein